MIGGRLGVFVPSPIAELFRSDVGGSMKAKRTVISVLVGTANAMTGELLAAALNRKSHIRVVGIATTTTNLLKSVQAHGPDVVLVNSTLADGPLSGFAALRQLRENRPTVKPILLLENPDLHHVVDAFRSGAKGVFAPSQPAFDAPSQSAFKMLCRCVDRVQAGHIWASGFELNAVMEAFSQMASLRVVNADGMRLLTKREEDVVRFVAEGMQNREIARELNLSEHTIKNYLFHIFDKLGVSSRVEVALYAVSCTKRTQLATDGEGGQEDEAAEWAKTAVRPLPDTLRLGPGGNDGRRQLMT
jgi:DNA-binding NarL/FixJ family response regulator